MNDTDKRLIKILKEILAMVSVITRYDLPLSIKIRFKLKEALEIINSKN